MNWKIYNYHFFKNILGPLRMSPPPHPPEHHCIENVIQNVFGSVSLLEYIHFQFVKLFLSFKIVLV